MSAMMSTLSMISGGRRTHRKLASSRKSGQYSDAGEDRQRTHHDLSAQQRSASLQTLEADRGAGAANLDTLEAKMASIEHSLASPRRRSMGVTEREATCRELTALRTAITEKDALIQSLKKQLGASLSAARLIGNASPNSKRSSPPASPKTASSLSVEERRALEDRSKAVRADLEARRANIRELRGRLERTHVTDNIDTRIQQAELQYKLGREELELLTLSEQARALAQLIEQADAAQRTDNTLFSAVREFEVGAGAGVTLLAAEVFEGCWSAIPRGYGLYLDWTREHVLRPGDRLIEVNGSMVVSYRSQEELQRVVVLMNPVRVVVLRAPTPQPQPSHAYPPSNALTENEAASLRTELAALKSAADDAEKAKEGLRTDNTRLTHRISYLEEQVAELLARHTQIRSVSSNDSSCITVNKTKKNVTNINITTDSQDNKSTPKSEVQVFQKGPDITAIVAKLPGLNGAESSLPLMRPRSNASGASSKAAISPRESPAPNYRSYSSHSLEHRSSRIRHSLSHHCIHGAIDYDAETDAAIRMIERNQRHIEKQRIKSDRRSRSKTDEFRSDSDVDVRDSLSNISSCDQKHNEIQKVADKIEESIKKTNWAERKTLSIIEQLKRSQRLRKMKKNDSSEDIQYESDRFIYQKIDGKIIENALKSNRRCSKLHSRSAKSSEFESESSDYPNGDTYRNSPKIHHGTEMGSTRLSHYKKNECSRDNEVKSRPTPPRKPLRLSLHKARSAHSLANGSETELPSRPVSEFIQSGEIGEDMINKKPVKRTHATDKWLRESSREGCRATPRPLRKHMNGLSTCETPAADDLYPENTLSSIRPNGFRKSTGRWC